MEVAMIFYMLYDVGPLTKIVQVEESGNDGYPSLPRMVPVDPPEETVIKTIYSCVWTKGDGISKDFSEYEVLSSESPIPRFITKEAIEFYKKRGIRNDGNVP